VENDAGCFEIDSIHIAFYLPAIADKNNLKVIPTTCRGSTGVIRGIVISGNSLFVYQWVDDLSNPIGNAIDIFRLPIGNYTLLVTDSNNYTTMFGPYSIYDAGDILIQQVDYTQEHCQQQDGSITVTAVSGLGDTIESQQGCMGEDSIYILFWEPPVPPEPIHENIYIPNAFSPDGDGLNDEFKVIGNSDNISSFHMYIYDRWGTLVFESNEISVGWDGKYKGNPSPTGAYVYKVEYSFSSPAMQESKIKSGTLVLVR
jgi:gliding motility-associated-like protein